ncbi:hypothetical protein [Acetivibrio cellulolyticus]|uniref:hypothetical protein n=1 Tax=Acetivibrio cellulolyticus TaxID=35830 RepID=UPI0001E2FB5E|nr:hypothetical protein [Acetivibrio cellulolyticus]
MYGICEFTGASVINGNEFILFAQYDIKNADGAYSVWQVKKVSATGKVVFDESELIPVTLNISDSLHE